MTEFAAASFRFGHSLLRPHLPRLSPQYQPVEPPILLRDGFFRVDMFMDVSIKIIGKLKLELRFTKKLIEINSLKQLVLLCKS